MHSTTRTRLRRGTRLAVLVPVTLALLASPGLASAGAPSAATPSPDAALPGAQPSADAPATVGDDGVTELDEQGVAPEQRDDVLGEDRERDDEAHVVLNDADRLTVLSARAEDGYAWHAAATLPLPWSDTDLWVSNSCVTSSGDHLAVVYAPRSATNSEEGFAGGARAAVVDLRSGAVTDLGTGYTISYFNPGCGAGDTVTITRFEAGYSTTRIAVVDAASATVRGTNDVDGLATSAVARDDGTVVAVHGGDVVALAPGAAEPEVLATTPGPAYDLALDDQDRLAYVTLDDDQETATAYVTPLEGDSKPRAIGTGPVEEVGVEAAQDGGFYLTGEDVKASLRGTPDVELLPEAGPDSVISSTGDLVVDDVKPAGIADAPPVGGPRTSTVVDETEPQISATARDSGKPLRFALDESRLAEPSSAVAPADDARGTSATDRSATDRSAAAAAGTSVAAATGTGDPHDPVEAERVCSVPRNDPQNQAYQPKPRQVEWAVDRAVKGELSQLRPAGWRNLGMPAYSPQGLFPPRQLVGGGTIPPQIVLGILAQESNLWQASRFTAPGNTGNPLVGDFYGSDDTTSIWHIDYSEADCGYGIGQITDGMRLAGHERTDPETGQPIETALPWNQQRAIALDYTANIAKAVQMLGDKWNELANAGMLVNDGNPAYIENWFLTTWAYNSGFHPRKDATSPWGVGWFNNPVNTIYSPTRTPFLETQGDAAHPQDWPYPEKIIGWAAFGTALVETQYADPGTRKYVSQYVSSFRTAWWNSEADRTLATPETTQFCDLDVNDCDPDAAEPCRLSTSQDHYYECWWHEPVVWKNADSCDAECGHGFERFPSSYATEASAMASSLPALTLRSSYLANCDPPPSGVVVVDDTTHRNARNNGECSHRVTAGSFQYTFGSPDAYGRYPAKVDLHQQGGGYNGHFSFAHMQARGDDRQHVTGTWSRGASMNGTWTRVWVHLPDYAGWTQQAGYTIDLGDGTKQTRYLPQRRYKNEWVSLGVFQMKGVPTVSLSNVLVDPSTTMRYGSLAHVDIDGYDDVAWDAVGFQALPDRPDDFVVALGDSFASGEGAGSYAPWSDNNGTILEANNACHQSANAWIRKTTLPGDSASIGSRADSADPGMDFHFLACSGAQSENLLPYHSWPSSSPDPEPQNAEGEGGMYGQSGMVSQLDAGYLDANTTLVTLSIGGNDMRFSGIVSACVQAYYVGTPQNRLSADCSIAEMSGDQKAVVQASKDRLASELPASLATVLKQVRDRAPNARIALFGYPKLFETGTTCLPVAAVNQAWLNDLADDMNATIRIAAETADKPNEPDVFFVDTQSKFTGHNLCTGAGVSGINGLQFSVTAGEAPSLPHFGFFVQGQYVSRTSVHPNELGTGLYAQALEAALAAHP